MRANDAIAYYEGILAGQPDALVRSFASGSFSNSPDNRASCACPTTQHAAPYRPKLLSRFLTTGILFRNGNEVAQNRRFL